MEGTRIDVLYFLSHLCGDEVRVLVSIVTKLFLSHLCGDEGKTTFAAHAIIFLSHLCGDEA